MKHRKAMVVGTKEAMIFTSTEAFVCLTIGDESEVLNVRYVGAVLYMFDFLSSCSSRGM